MSFREKCNLLDELDSKSYFDFCENDESDEYIDIRLKEAQKREKCTKHN